MAKKEVADEKILDGKVLRRIFTFVKPYILRFYLIIFLTVLSGILAPIKPYLIQYTIDNHILTNDYMGLHIMVMVLIGLTLFHGVIQFLHAYLSGWLGQYIILDIRHLVFQHLLKRHLRYYDHTPIGRLVTRSISEVERLSTIFTDGFANIIGDLLQIFFIFGVMFYTDWKLTLVSLSMLPLLLYSTYIFKEKIKQSFNEVSAAVSNLNSFVQEHVTGMAIVQIFNSEKREYKKFIDINKEHRHAQIKTVLYYSVYFPVVEIISAAGTGLLVWYGASGVIEEHITLGTLIAFIMYISMFFRPIRTIADRFNNIQMGIVSSNRIINLIDDQADNQENGHYNPTSIHGEIEFKNVWFAYKEDEYVLKDVSFEVKKGEIIAIVGATGAGKSSIVNLISRFYEINKGEICIDNHPIQEYDLNCLRSSIGVVLQDVFLFSGSILDNITLKNPAISIEKAMQAAEMIGAKSFIERLPQGFDYDVMERGATLSAGQRQMISFVRAMVYDPKIIILDEATSSVDTETEELIQNAIGKLMQGRTSIVIAHRLATIQKANKIIVMDKGQIKEIGTHDELLAKGGFYAKLHEMQHKSILNHQ